MFRDYYSYPSDDSHKDQKCKDCLGSVEKRNLLLLSVPFKCSKCYGVLCTSCKTGHTLKCCVEKPVKKFEFPRNFIFLAQPFVGMPAEKPPVAEIPADRILENDNNIVYLAQPAEKPPVAKMPVKTLPVTDMSNWILQNDTNIVYHFLPETEKVLPFCPLEHTSKKRKFVETPKQVSVSL